MTERTSFRTEKKPGYSPSLRGKKVSHLKTTGLKYVEEEIMIYSLIWLVS